MTVSTSLVQCPPGTSGAPGEQVTTSLEKGLLLHGTPRHRIRQSCLGHAMTAPSEVCGTVFKAPLATSARKRPRTIALSVSGVFWGAKDMSAQLLPGPAEMHAPATGCGAFSSSGSGTGIAAEAARGGAPPPVPPRPRVRFSAEPVILGFADPNYDRRSIQVDLSRTPYALFHKDYVLMTRPRLSPVGRRGRKNSWDGSESDGSTSDATECSSDTGSAGSDEEEGDAVAGGGGGGGSGEGVGMGPPTSRAHNRKGTPSTNFFGVWKRVSAENFVELLQFSGVPAKVAAGATKRHPVHIIDHDDDFFRLIVKNGLSKVDTSYFIGDEPRQETVGSASYEVSLRWGDMSGNGVHESLVLTSICRTKGEELIAVRTLEEGGNTLVLTQIVRKPATNEEVRARHVFQRVTDRAALKSSQSKITVTTNTENASAVAKKMAVTAVPSHAPRSGGPAPSTAPANVPAARPKICR